MKNFSKRKPFQDFQKEKLKKQEMIKGGPETSRGTTTTVQSGTG